MNVVHCEKEQLIIDFFDIGSLSDKATKIISLKQHKEKLNLFLNKADNSENNIEINNLINAINAILIYMIEDNKEKAKTKVAYLWDIWNSQNTFNLYDIRLMNSILCTSDTLEDCINNTINALNQLEKYNKHEKYFMIKTTLYYNLSHFLMKANYSNEKNNIRLINTTLDKFLSDTINMLVDLSMKYSSDHLFPKALIKKGLLLKDKGIIFAGLALINDKDSKEKIELIKKYDIYFITYNDLL